jgi:hypothetical protein
MQNLCQKWRLSANIMVCMRIFLLISNQFLKLLVFLHMPAEIKIKINVFSLYCIVCCFFDDVIKCYIDANENISFF